MARNAAYWSSDSDDSSDSDNGANQRTYLDRKDPFDELGDSEFYERFRFSKDSYIRLLRLVENHLKHKTDRSHALSPHLQLLIALRYFATGSFQQVIGDTLNVHRSTVCRVVHRVARVIVEHLSPRYIRFPSRDAEISEQHRRFREKANFPGVVAALDCTHVRIQRPTRDPDDFVNRKGYHSINVQALVDSDGSFLNVVSKWPGSAHDGFILRDSSVWDSFETGQFRNSGLVLGDRGYAPRRWLMTPVLANNPTRPETRYNTAHSRTRIEVERAFGRLKRRFHILHSEVRLDPGRASTIIVACCTLHNLAQLWQDPHVWGDDDPDRDDDLDAIFQHDTGTARRDAIIDAHFR